MPTGYTAKLVRDDQTFPEFAKTCMRAFLVCMRDAPDDAPIPEFIEPSTYQAEALKEAEAAYARLSRMTQEEQEAHGATLRSDKIRRQDEYLSEQRKENKRLEMMRIRVCAWTPPTQDHQAFKSFMLQQIDASTNDVYYTENRLQKAKEKSLQDYYNEALAFSLSDITYHTKELDQEIRNATETTKWLQDLRESLGE